MQVNGDITKEAARYVLRIAPRPHLELEDVSLGQAGPINISGYGEGHNHHNREIFDLSRRLREATFQ